MGSAAKRFYRKEKRERIGEKGKKAGQEWQPGEAGEKNLTLRGTIGWLKQHLNEKKEIGR